MNTQYFGYAVVSCMVMTAIFWMVNSWLLYTKKSRESFLGASDQVFSKGARGYGFSYVNPTRTTLSSEGCRMPSDLSASTLPYCELLTEITEKAGCYLNCIQTYPGGIRGICYPNLLATYNSYAAEANSPDLPLVQQASCSQDDPCCTNPTSVFSLYNFLP